MTELNANAIPVGSVIITPAEMYREMQDIGRKVDRLTLVIDPALDTLRTAVTETRAHMEVMVAERRTEDAKLDGRVRALENWRWFVLGIAVVFGPVGGYALSVLLGGR